jgi:O-antigen ligase
MNRVLAGIAVLVACSVAAFGGVQPSGEAALEVGAALLFAFWGLQIFRTRLLEIHGNVLYAPLLGLWGIGLAQLGLGLTASPYATKIELLKWAACGLLVFLFIQCCRTRQQVRGFLFFLASLSFTVALFGILQYFTWNGKLYWMLVLPQGAGPFGPFVNRDHFAGFVELTAPLALAPLLHHAGDREKRALLAVLAVVPVGALFLSASRGGIIAFLFECVILLRLAGTKRFGKAQWLGAAALTAVAGTFVVWLGVTQALQRFAALTAGEISHDRRVSMYRDTWHIFEKHPWTGTGLGTLLVVYPQFESHYDGLVVDHAHNDYLELLADTGLAGGICGLALIAMLARRGLANWAESEDRFVRAARAGALAGCGGILLHSLVDFNLHIPSNGLLFLLLAALATMSLNGETERREGGTQEVGGVPL